MDSKPQMPDIKAEVNKVDDGKKKATGLLGLLSGGGGTGAAGGLGGLGAGSVGAGGLLATKAGMLALVLMGSAVAGGIGLAGYKMFGPGESDKTGGNLSLFAPRTQPAVDPNAVAPVNADGSSASLNFMSAAAAKDKAAEDAAAAAAAAAASASAEAPTDNTAGDPAKDAAAADAARRQAEARAASGGALNAGGGSGASGTMNLANVKKLGALSGATGGGATTSASASTKLGDSMANAARNGPSSAFSRQTGGAAKASSSSGRGMNRRNQTARQQAIGVKGDQRGAGSSFAAGKTYDGSTAGGGGAVGPDGGGIGMGGVGDGAGAQPKSLAANSANQTNEQEPPPAEPPAKDVTPWAKQIMIGMALGAAAIALLYAASSLISAANTEYPAALAASTATVGASSTLMLAVYSKLFWAKMIIYAALAASVGGLIMGGMITGGTNGQVLQGGLLIASSALIGTIGLSMLKYTDVPFPDPEKPVKDAKLAAFKETPTWMNVIGGMAAVGLVGAMMAPKKTCKADQDECHGSIQQQYRAPANRYLV